jgi:hypothetical protein
VETHTQHTERLTLKVRTVVAKECLDLVWRCARGDVPVLGLPFEERISYAATSENCHMSSGLESLAHKQRVL